MPKMIRCPWHDDTTPSMAIYGNKAFCFVCRVSAPIEEMNLMEREKRQANVQPTNIPARIKYIDALPKRKIRGLDLPYDDRGYYIVWPNKEYYKLRVWKPMGNNRYIAPQGIKPPLMVYPGGSRTLVIVEGELNAMSLHNAIYGEYKVVSPGSAANLQRYIKYYLQYRIIYIIVDKDAPGVVYGLNLKEALLRHKCVVHLAGVEKDFNATLEEKGEESVREQFEQIVGVPGKLS